MRRPMASSTTYDNDDDGGAELQSFKRGVTRGAFFKKSTGSLKGV